MNNELKYVLLPKIETRRRTPKFQPWYRERFKRKYPRRMNTKTWKFVKDGLDDFRDGLPPPHDDIILEPEKGPGPVVLSESPRRVKANASNIRHRLRDYQIYLSRELPTAEKRRQLIEYYISTILDHPVAFFSHFNEVLKPEMYNRLTRLLEAELVRMTNPIDDSNVVEYKEMLSISTSLPITRPETSVTEKTDSERSNPSNNPTQQDDQSDMKSISTRRGKNPIVVDESRDQEKSKELELKENNPYRWYIEKQREKQNPKDLTEVDEETSAMEARLRYVAEHFCNWLHDLSDEARPEIDPAVVRNLFSTAYDTKPSLSVPIRIIEMTRIPPELREGVQESMVASSELTKSTLPDRHSISSTMKKLPTLPIASEGQSPRRYRYGAWYLPKNLWQRSLVTEELRDPKVIKAELDDETKKREEEINARLAPLHGIDSFREYLVERNVHRLPKLITDVEQYRQGHPRESTDLSVSVQSKAAS